MSHNCDNPPTDQATATCRVTKASTSTNQDVITRFIISCIQDKVGLFYIKSSTMGSEVGVCQKEPSLEMVNKLNIALRMFYIQISIFQYSFYHNSLLRSRNQFMINQHLPMVCWVDQQFILEVDKTAIYNGKALGLCHSWSLNQPCSF